MHIPKGSFQPFFKLMTVVILLLLVTGLLQFHFRGQAYDSSEVGLLSQYSDQYPGLGLWTSGFGQSEVATRVLSQFWTFIALALLYRIGRDLDGHSVGWIAALVAGSVIFSQLLAGRALPYALLLVVTMGMQLIFQRWLRKPQIVYTVVYGLLAAVGFIYYPLAVWFVVVHAIYAAWRLKGKWWLIALLAAIGVLRWLMSGNVTQVWEAPEHFQSPLTITSVEILQLILVFGLAAASRISGRWKPADTLPMLTLSGGLLLNAYFYSGNVRSAFLLMLLPVLAIMAARTLQGISQIPRTAALLLVFIPALVSFPSYRSTEPYKELLSTADIQLNEPILIELPTDWQRAAARFYLTEHDPTRELEVVGGSQSGDQVATFVAGAPIFWYLADEQATYASQFDKNYALAQSIQWAENPNDPFRMSLLLKYVRIPEFSAPVATLGKTLQLRGRTTQPEGVLPCQTLTVQTWWSLETAAPTNYSVVVAVLAPDGTGITQQDGLLGNRESLLWEIGRPYVDERRLKLPCDLAAGDYPLKVGVYSQDNGQIQRLPVTSDPDAQNDLIDLTTIHVK